MYPNPANSYVNIAQGTELIKQVNVYNIVGNAVFRIPDASSQAVIQYSNAFFSQWNLYYRDTYAKSVYRDKLIVHN